MKAIFKTAQNGNDGSSGGDGDSGGDSTPDTRDVSKAGRSGAFLSFTKWECPYGKKKCKTKSIKKRLT